MTAELKLILTALGDFLNGRTTEETDADWEKVYQSSISHQIAAILYHQCKRWIPDTFQHTFHAAYLSQISGWTIRKNLLSEMESALDREGIPFLIFKGMEVAQRYPVPALRSMGDCDLLVRREDRERARELFLKNGFNAGSFSENGDTLFKNGMEFELHHRLLYDETVNTGRGRAFCDRVWDYAGQDGSSALSSRYVLDGNFHYVFLLLHLRKHLMNKGVGFRQFMDAAVWRRGLNPESPELKRMLRETGIERFEETCAHLCGKWFDGDDIEDGSLDTFFEQATEWVFRGGVFGFEQENLEETAFLNSVKESGKPRLILRHLFPSYEAFADVPYYSFVKGKPYLLPAAWIYRIYRAFRFGKIEGSREYASDILKSDEKMQDREIFLHSWGIDDWTSQGRSSRRIERRRVSQ